MPHQFQYITANNKFFCDIEFYKMMHLQVYRTINQRYCSFLLTHEYCLLHAVSRLIESYVIRRFVFVRDCVFHSSILPLDCHCSFDLFYKINRIYKCTYEYIYDYITSHYDFCLSVRCVRMGQVERRWESEDWMCRHS